MELNLREHHCLGDETPLMAGSGGDQFGADPLNAWIPRGTEFNENNVSLLCSFLNIPFCLRSTSRLGREEWRDGDLRN